MGSSYERASSRAENVARGVHVAIVNRSALAARPLIVYAMIVLPFAAFRCRNSKRNSPPEIGASIRNDACREA
jgi:hypothetical protein